MAGGGIAGDVDNALDFLFRYVFILKFTNRPPAFDKLGSTV